MAKSFRCEASNCVTKVAAPPRKTEKTKPGKFSAHVNAILLLKLCIWRLRNKTFLYDTFMETKLKNFSPTVRWLIL